MKKLLRPLASLVSFALAAAVASAADAGLGDSFKGPIGLQLYSLRAQFTANGVPKTLDTVKGFCLRYAEIGRAHV